MGLNSNHNLDDYLPNIFFTRRNNNNNNNIKNIVKVNLYQKQSIIYMRLL
jgi:hypothetical protein